MNKKGMWYYGHYTPITLNRVALLNCIGNEFYHRPKHSLSM